jgi:putative endonuclease
LQEGNAPVAQLDRASGYEPEGREFESLRAHHFVAMFHVYVLQSENTGRHYLGHTSDLTQRLGQHNNGITKSTKNRGPWKLIYQENFPTKVDAMKRERFLKSGQGREELKQLLSMARSAG